MFAYLGDLCGIERLYQGPSVRLTGEACSVLGQKQFGGINLGTRRFHLILPEIVDPSRGRIALLEARSFDLIRLCRTMAILSKLSGMEMLLAIYVAFMAANLCEESGETLIAIEYIGKREFRRLMRLIPPCLEDAIGLLNSKGLQPDLAAIQAEVDRGALELTPGLRANGICQGWLTQEQQLKADRLLQGP